MAAQLLPDTPTGTQQLHNLQDKEKQSYLRAWSRKMRQAEYLGSVYDLSWAVAQLTSERALLAGAHSHVSNHCLLHPPLPLSALHPDLHRLQVNFTTWNAVNTINYEIKAHLERRQKSAPFSVSQLSPPPHHVLLKLGAVPSTKCTGKHILGPAVIWSWHIGCGWIRNQLIGPGTMQPLVRLREQPSPSASPIPSPVSLQQNRMPGQLL